MHTPRTAVAAVAALTTLAAAGASVAASTSHTKFWTNPTGKVDCGIMKTSPANTEVLCSSQSIPAPPHSNANQGDPGFVQIAKTGKPKLLRLSQDSFVTTNATKLHAGTTWSSLGVTCKVASKSVTCTNKSSHGFEINGSKKYRSF